MKQKILMIAVFMLVATLGLETDGSTGKSRDIVE